MPQHFAVLRHEWVIPFFIYSIYSSDREALKWFCCPGYFVSLQYLVLVAEIGFWEPVKFFFVCLAYLCFCDTLVKGRLNLSPNM
jgi:hypothetical protein